MELSSRQLEILRAAEAFATVERYNGILPKRQALQYANKDLAALEDAGFLQRVKLSFPCGRTVTGWRLTDAGRQALPGHGGEETQELEPEHLRIVHDVYHASRITAHRGMMPKKMARQFDADDLRDLFNHGYLLRIRIKSLERGKGKGWILSGKGLRALRRAMVLSAVCDADVGAM